MNPQPPTVLIIGAGLLGTSLGLALRAQGITVHLEDRDTRSTFVAVALGAGSAAAPEAVPDLVVIAVPPRDVADLVVRTAARFPEAVITDVASVKAQIQAEVKARAGSLHKYVGGHPMAGRERTGPEAAHAELFDGRPWVLTPDSDTDPEAVERVRVMVELVGAVPQLMDAERHDAAVALVSHMPQVVASLAAGRLVAADADLVDIAGQGLRDTTRIAGSSPSLWVDILSANAAAVAAVLGELEADLAEVRRALTAPDADTASVLEHLLEQGRRGRSRIPGKHGAGHLTYVAVPVAIPDQPGALAGILAAASAAQVNVEDLTIEHAPAQASGLVELWVAQGTEGVLVEALRADGWVVHHEDIHPSD